MYGMVNKAIEAMVVSNHGWKIWEQIKCKAGVEHELFISMESYADEITYNLVAAASVILNIPEDEVLRQLGRWWVLKTALDNYGHLIKAGGRTIGEFLLNLPNFHTRIQMMFPELKPPEFSCSDVQPTELRLHYRSQRLGLSAFAFGLLEGLGEMFEVTLELKHEERVSDGADHDVFYLRWESAGKA